MKKESICFLSFLKKKKLTATLEKIRIVFPGEKKIIPGLVSILDYITCPTFPRSTNFCINENTLVVIFKSFVKTSSPKSTFIILLDWNI